MRTALAAVAAVLALATAARAEPDYRLDNERFNALQQDYVETLTATLKAAHGDAAAAKPQLDALVARVQPYYDAKAKEFEDARRAEVIAQYPPGAERERLLTMSAEAEEFFRNTPSELRKSYENSMSPNPKP